MFVPDFAEVVDGLSQLLCAVEAGAGQGFSSENAKPDFDLVEPRRRCRGEVKRHVRMRFQPIAIFLVRGVIVENDVDLLIGGRVFDDFVHERLEIHAGFCLRRLFAHFPGGQGSSRH